MTAIGSGVSSASRIHKLEATFELVTPAFVAGAVPKEKAELRLPSILGPLRFWWRALAWSRTTGSDDETRLKQMRDWESALFGGPAAYDTNGRPTVGQGSFVGRLVPCRQSPEVNNHETRLERLVGGYDRDCYAPNRQRPWQRDGSGIAYLAGLGLIERGRLIDEHGNPLIRRDRNGNCVPLKGAVDRRASNPIGTVFKIALRTRSAHPWHVPESVESAENAPSLIEALELFGLIGGIGSRARRGFGSVRLVSASGGILSAPTTPEQYADRLRQLLGDARSQADFSALSTVGHAVVVKTSATDICGLHGEMGHRLHHYRGWGFKIGRGDHKVGGELANHERFKSDHDWLDPVLDAPECDCTPLTEVPERSVFGLPHNYQSSSRPRRPVEVSPGKIDPNGEKAEFDRRASPLFLHIHRFDNTSPRAVWLLFENRFLPDGLDGNPHLQVQRFKGSGELREYVRPTWRVRYCADYDVIKTFLTPVHLDPQSLGAVIDLLTATPPGSGAVP
ncbi:MAG: hypothetical protein R3C70_10980 [Geminicoccaceae bacterium]